jgi:hypothetical protein
MSQLLFKTSTEKDDDEVFAELNAALKKAAKEITGRESSQAETARWGEPAEILVTELKIAAGRTTVSSVPAFLAEHLRRASGRRRSGRLMTRGRRSSPPPLRESTPPSALIVSALECGIPKVSIKASRAANIRRSGSKTSHFQIRITDE